MTEMLHSRFQSEPDAVRLLEKYGINYPEHKVAHSQEEAVSIAEALGFPVVLKVVSPQVIHKSDVGGVKVNICDSRTTRQAYSDLIKSVIHHIPEAIIQGVLVAKEAPKGEEIIIGVFEDEIFGKTIMFGIGGILTEIFRDVTFRVCPIDKKAAQIMIQEIRGYPILCGTRGKEKVDLDSLAILIEKISILAIENRHIQEIDLNPIRVYKNGLLVLDARLLLRPSEQM